MAKHSFPQHPFSISAPYEVEFRFDIRISGHSFLFSFENGYQASVTRSKFSYGGESGLWELAVMRDGKIVHDTPITNDVVGWLNHDQASELINKISELPKL